MIKAKTASITRIPVLSNNKNMKTSPHVIKIATHIGILIKILRNFIYKLNILLETIYNPLDSKLKATADPITCCISEAIIATSIMIHKNNRVNLLYSL